MTTHRCDGSLKAGISIRYGKGWFDNKNAWWMWSKGWFDNKNAWWMWKTVSDDEWNLPVLAPIAKIRFCPFCGQKLEAPKEKTSDER